MSSPQEHDELETRLREAFAAKAARVGPEDLDTDREEDLAARLRSRPARGIRRAVVGVGLLAAAAAAVAVVTLTVRPTGHQPTTALPAAASAGSTTSAPGTARSGTSGGSPSANAGAMSPQRLTPGTGTPLTSHSATSPPVTARSTNGAAATTGRGALSGPGISTPAAAAPPTLPTGLPQDGTLGSGRYVGPVPLSAAGRAGGRMLSMPDHATWEVTARGGHSLTLHLLRTPTTDVTAYWARTLPSQGWRRAEGGWRFPGTAYAVSTLTAAGSFTVTW